MRYANRRYKLKPIIQVENLSKLYRLGLIGVTSFRDSVERWWYRMRGKGEMVRKIGAKHLMIKPDDPQAGPEPNTLWALKDVSFSVQRGEIVGIIGKNGAGKSTLLKILTRITEPTSGRAIMRGRVSSLLEVGTGFHPELTGRENIYLNGAILGMHKVEIDRKFDEIVDFSEVKKFIDTPVKRYSSGMYVRLAFAVAAHLEPEILLVDEVLAVGDVAFQKKCLGKMGDVAKQGRTVLFISHNMAAISNLCPRTILLISGKVAMDDCSSRVIERYIGVEKDTGSEVIWSHPVGAPGDERARLHAVRILQDGKLTTDIDIQKDILIELSYWNLEEGAKLISSIHLIDSQGITVLTTGNLPSVSLVPDPWYGRASPKGLFRAVCRIPGNFLNEGTCFVSVFVATFVGIVTAHVAEEKIISFNVVDTGAMRKEFNGKWIGVVRPRLHWNTEYKGPLDEKMPVYTEQHKKDK